MIGTRDPPGVKCTRPCECLLYAFAYAEVSCVRREVVRNVIRINPSQSMFSPHHVMRTVFFSLAAAIVVSVGMLLLTTLHS